jgi:hypothetical protein
VADDRTVHLIGGGFLEAHREHVALSRVQGLLQFGLAYLTTFALHALAFDLQVVLGRTLVLSLEGVGAWFTKVTLEGESSNSLSLITMVFSTPPEVPLEVPSFVVVAADEAELYFPPPPEGPLVVALPEVVALPVLEDPPSPAEDPPVPPPPQLASTTASTSMKATKASVPFS